MIYDNDELSFGDLEMSNESGSGPNPAKIALVVGLIVVLVLAIVFFLRRGTDETPPQEVVTATQRPQDVPLVCANPDCGKSYSVTTKEYENLMETEVRSWSKGRPPRPNELKLPCKFCSQKSAEYKKNTTD